jgi:dihydropteroate synthase
LRYTPIAHMGISRKRFRLKLPSRTLVLGERTLVMGVLNITPDSFSDGGKFLQPESAIEHAFAIERAGADLLDVGGESTRPGSVEPSASEELDRILPVLEALRGRLKIPISVDTRRASVAELAIRAGAEIINDVSGLKSDPRIAEVAARHRVPLILMHMRGEPRTMQAGGFARDVMKDVMQGLRRSVAIARKAGVGKAQIIVDPGIGFGKSFAQNYELLQKLPQLAKLGYPLLVGTSRKGFLGATLARDGKAAPPEERIGGTAATVTANILNGAHIVRVHDVAEMVQVARVADCLLDPKQRPKNQHGG